MIEDMTMPKAAAARSWDLFEAGPDDGRTTISPKLGNPASRHVTFIAENCYIFTNSASKLQLG